MPPTERQIKIIAGVARGDGYQEIAERLNIHIETVRRDISKTPAAMGLDNCPRTMPAIVDAAYKAGLLTHLPHETRRYEPLKSPRHRVLQLIAEGLTNQQIGTRLHVAEATAKNYVTHLQDLGARNRHHAVALGHQLGHLTTPETP
jgi:DNA-binding NarL/FixJ family response regulator